MFIMCNNLRLLLKLLGPNSQLPCSDPFSSGFPAPNLHYLLIHKQTEISNPVVFIYSTNVRGLSRSHILTVLIQWQLKDPLEMCCWWWTKWISISQHDQIYAPYLVLQSFMFEICHTIQHPVESTLSAILGKVEHEICAISIITMSEFGEGDLACLWLQCYSPFFHSAEISRILF